MVERARPTAVFGIPRQPLLLGMKLLVTLGAFWFLVMLTDVSEALALVRNQNLALVAFAAFAVLLQIALGAFRWRSVLIASARQQAANISPWLAYRLYYASIFFNSFLPGGLGGDVVRVISTRTLGVTIGASVHSVVLDRILTLATLLLMALPALPLVWKGIGLPVSTLVAGAAIVPFLTVFYFGLGRISRLATLKSYADRALVSFRYALHNLLSHPRVLLAAVPLAFAAHAAYAVTAYLIARSLNIEFNLLDALMLMPLVLLVSTVPISIGGWGVREVGAIGLLGLVGVPSHEAVVISLQLGVVSVLMSLPGGLFWMSLKSRGPE